MPLGALLAAAILASAAAAMGVRALVRRRERRLVGALEAARETLEEKVRERTSDLTRAYNELQGLDRMKDSFISSVSHELRTPLSSIRAFSEILLDYADEDRQTRLEFLQIIHRESERLSRLVEEVLDLSRIESGRLSLRTEALDVRGPIADAVEACAVLASDAGLSLKVDLHPDLPDVRADADRVVQIVTNLIGNSIKFTPAGGEIRVSARAATPGEGAGPTAFVEVRVADTGSGIPKESLETIFEKFRQVGDPMTGKPRGTGLGLPICRDILRLMGGRIRAESGSGGGATFVFTLPVAAEPAGAPLAAPTVSALAARAAASARAPAPPRPGEGPRGPVVAVVDDEASIVEVVAETLRARGFDVVKGSDGDEALRLARDGSFDLLILDLQMPKLSGWQVLEALRSDPRTRGLPVIVLTGGAAENDRLRALSLGALEYLQKGQGLSRLCAEIEMATRGLPLPRAASASSREA